MDDYIDHNPEEMYEKNLKSELLDECIKELTDAQRLSVTMYYFEGYKIKEIADSLEQSENTVKTWLKRGKENIEKKLRVIEKEKGVKFYGVTPFMFFLRLFKNGDQYITAPDSFAGVSEKVMLSINKSATESILTNKAVSEASSKTVNNTVNKTVNTVTKKAAKTITKESVKAAAKTTFISTALGKSVVGVTLVAMLAVGGLFGYNAYQNKQKEAADQEWHDRLNHHYRIWEKTHYTTEDVLNQLEEYLAEHPDSEEMKAKRDNILEYIEAHSLIKIRTYTDDWFDMVVNSGVFNHLEYLNGQQPYGGDLTLPNGTRITSDSYDNNHTNFFLDTPGSKSLVPWYEPGNEVLNPYCDLGVYNYSYDDSGTASLKIIKCTNRENERVTVINIYFSHCDFEKYQIDTILSATYFQYSFVLDEEDNVTNIKVYQTVSEEYFDEFIQRFDQAISPIGIKVDDFIDIEAVKYNIRLNNGFVDPENFAGCRVKETDMK